MNDDENNFRYFAEVFEHKRQYYYRRGRVVIEITETEYDYLIKNPYLYYFSTALKMHLAVQSEKDKIILETLLKVSLRV